MRMKAVSKSSSLLLSLPLVCAAAAAGGRFWCRYCLRVAAKHTDARHRRYCGERSAAPCSHCCRPGLQAKVLVAVHQHTLSRRWTLKIITLKLPTFKVHACMQHRSKVTSVVPDQFAASKCGSNQAYDSCCCKLSSSFGGASTSLC